MSLAIKLQSGGNAPSTYTMYGRTYNFDDFQRSADEGFNDYLAGLKRGEKDADQFREAYANMMSGIKDGTITFENGHYHDSKGRYTNSKKKHKDYYGLVANYLYSKQGKSGETGFNWNGSASIGRDLTKAIFNSETGNIQDFIDLDSIDEKTKKRGIGNRANYLANKLQEIYNTFDTRYQGYTAQEKAEALSNIQAAITALRDGRIDAGDYLALSRAASGLNYRGMFGEESSPTIQLDSETPTISVAPQQTSITQAQREEAFKQYLNKYFPSNTSRKTINLTDSTKFSSSGWTKTQLMKAVTSFDKDTLINMIQNMLTNKDYLWSHDSRTMPYFANKPAAVTEDTALKYLLNAGISRNLFEKLSDGRYYIPESYNQQTKQGWDISADGESISTVNLQDVPSLVNMIKSEFAKKFTAYHKEGGILKAQEGTSFNNIYASGEGVDTGYNTYLNRIFGNSDVLNWMKTHYTGDNATADYADYVKKNVNDRAQYGINDYANSPTYTANEGVRTFNTGYQNGGNTLNYTLFGNNSNDYNNKTGGAAYSLINFSRPAKALKTGDSYQGNTSKDYIDDALGLQTYSRVASLTDPNIKTGGFGDWGSYWKGLGNTGAYYYIAEGDTSGKGQWIPTSDTKLNGYQAFDAASPQPSTPSTSSTPTTPVLTRSSNVNLTSEPAESQTPGVLGTIGNAVKTVATNGDLVGAGRLFYSLRTNNRVADVIRKSLNPVLKDTYELYSPVTGAFSEMQFRNRQAADTRRLGARVAASNSDASLGAAALLDANKQATDLQYQGFLADDKEIKRTQTEALKRQEDNAARRSGVANYNRASINATNREKAELEATRLKSNWQSADNFLAGIEQRQRAKYAEDKARTQQFNYAVADDQLTREVNDYLSPETTRVEAARQKWLSIPSDNTAASTQAYNEYLAATQAYAKKKNQLSDWILARQRANYAGAYGLNYTSPYLSQTAEQYWDKRYDVSSKRNGGSLSLKSMNLINKIIYESHS